MHDSSYPPLGALPQDDGVLFRVWAPKPDDVQLALNRCRDTLPMEPVGDGYYELHVSEAKPGDRYRFLLEENQLLPDPASRFQPEGVHGPSMVVDPSVYAWQDEGWSGIPREDLVFYELHVGTFSPEGSFNGVQERLPYLRDLGVTAIELMPVADFPGRWNWGYDHAALYAPANTYGTPDDLRRLVDAAHHYGLAVYLDVIYNHLGPDGAYITSFAPMFTDKHETPWGQGLNFDDDRSDGVRSLFIDNALHWLREYHIDGLRLDATHAIKDDSPVHFLAELNDAVRSLEEGWDRHLIAEDPRNINTFLLPRERGGYGLDGVWTDDFHHQVRHMTAGDEEGYYANYAGHRASELAVTINDGWYYQGQKTPDGTPFGTDPSDIDLDQCVICIQNHDQVGNRPEGRRLHHEIDAASYRAATALLLFAPELPLLFMGQEWAASTPFQFFTDHNPDLGEKVREGRREEFEDFSGFSGEVPDPQSTQTVRRSTLEWDEREEGAHARTLALYHALLDLRSQLDHPPDATAHGDYGLAVQRGDYTLCVALDDEVTVPRPSGQVALHTEDPEYAEEPTPPDIGDDEVRFLRSGAVIFRTGSA